LRPATDDRRIALRATEFRDVRNVYFKKGTLPTATLLQVARLANPAYLLEVEAIAVLPPKG
jgi:enamine deaminase RidA (YjgF/YER057c/UK114 family)